MITETNINYYGYKNYSKYKTYICEYCKKEFKLIKGEMLYKLAHLTFCSYKCRSEYKKIESEKMKNE